MLALELKAETSRQSCVAVPTELAGNVLPSLRLLFGQELAVVDTATDRLAAPGPGIGTDIPEHWFELCRQVVRRGQAEFIAEHEPLLVLAVPLALLEREQYVAVGVFHSWSSEAASKTRRNGSNLAGACQQLGLNTAAATWLSAQAPWPAERLLAVARTLVERQAAEARAAQAGDDIDKMAAQLSSTYEEISLLHRLARNLRISENDEALARATLGWLADALPVNSLALELAATPERQGASGRAEPLFLAKGPCPVNGTEFGRLLERLGVTSPPRMLIVNPPFSAELAAEFPGLPPLVVAPLVEGDHLFGWLAAFGQRCGEELGSSEASLLASVGALLGIHCGNLALYRQQAEMLGGIVRALTSAIDAKDPYTHGHSDRVARIAVALAAELGCSRQQLDTIYLSGLLHDVGKIGIDDQVLRKQGQLTDAEFEHIKLHPEIGYRILIDLKQLGDVLPVVRHHHESWDGKGYPLGLKGEQIPQLARIVSVADAFDAMSSDRPYREGMPDERLDAILRGGAGQQWDSRVIDAFFRIRDKIRRIAARPDEREPLVDEICRLA